MEQTGELKMYRVNATVTVLVQAEGIDQAEDAAFEALVDNFGYEVAKHAAYHDPELVEE